MKSSLSTYLLLIACCLLLFTSNLVKGQSLPDQPMLDYYELKGLLLKHKATAESILSLKQFRPVSSKERLESVIYAYKHKDDNTQLLIRVRKRDGLVSEIAWDEGSSTLGNLTHDAVFDGFVPVSGNSQYYNRFQKLALFVHYKLAEGKVVPCILRAVE